jgi:hypothetical protein
MPVGARGELRLVLQTEGRVVAALPVAAGGGWQELTFGPLELPETQRLDFVVHRNGKALPAPFLRLDYALLRWE